MTDAEEIRHPNDSIVITIDIDDCPLVEAPLEEIFCFTTRVLNDNYHDVIRDYVTQQLEDTPWLTDAATTTLFDAGFGMYHTRDRGVVISLRKPALQRLINDRIANRDRSESPVHVPILIRFLLAEVDLPRPPRTSVGTRGSNISRGSRSRLSNPPSDIDAELSVESEMEASQTPIAATVPTTTVNVPMPMTTQTPEVETVPTIFRGHQIDMRPTADTRPTERFRHGQYHTPHVAPNRPLFDSVTTNRTNALTRTPTRNHPFSAEVTFGAETFDEYMVQFMHAEVKFKDFRKATIPKFDSSKQDSFVHWYKLFCSTCLQWGVWCPPYESAQEDNIHGSWWTLLPASVRAADRFMSGLIYSALILDTTFPTGSKELNAVEGCPPNAGYHALYSLLRLHHPLLHSIYSTANEIPKQRRSESFSLYTRRLQDFMARERLATRTYTESEALDLAVRNLHPDWSQEFRRMVERDKRTGLGGSMPFKLTMPQLATTFVEYSAEIGRDAPSGNHNNSYNNASRSHHHPTIRRIETSPSHSATTLTSDTNLGDEEIDLIVRAIAQNQATSSLCIGCQQPGHTLEQCNRFVDYIVAESLAQRHPQLKAQVALAHRQFRKRLANTNNRSSNSATRTVRSLQLDATTMGTDESPTVSDTDCVPPDPSSSVNDEDSGILGYQQHAIQSVSADPDGDFESCFSPYSVQSVTVATIDYVLSPLLEAVDLSNCALPDVLLQRRLAATHDPMTDSMFAHADNGSMACTTNDRNLLFAYRPLSANASVRLFDAGQHAHRPVGVGFLRVPVDHREISGAPTSVFVRTYYTPTIPGIIISHSAISRQLGTDGYHMSSFRDAPGHIHFPHRLRRSQDIHITLQPTEQRGGLTFTDALLVPSELEKSAALPAPNIIHRLCSDHHAATQSAATILDPTDGMDCHFCHNPPRPDFQ